MSSSSRYQHRAPWLCVAVVCLQACGSATDVDAETAAQSEHRPARDGHGSAGRVELGIEGAAGRDGAARSERTVDDVHDVGRCVELRAHGEPRPLDESAFRVPAGESYHCFNFRSPFPEGAQGVTIEPLIEGEASVHHMLLFDVHSTPADGSIVPCYGAHADAAVMSGWAPGAGATIFPDDVGMQLPDGDDGYFRLEMHYINFGDDEVTDRSGLRICAASSPRPHTAAITWLGTENIGGPIGIPPGAQLTATGRCRPQRAGMDDDAPVHLMLALPHMHRLGRRVELLVERAEGERESLLDVAFDPDEQVGYVIDAEVFEGDTLETRCTYDNGSDVYVPYGPGDGQEMCYVFALAYPAGALDHPGFSFSGARNTCFL